MPKSNEKKRLNTTMDAELLKKFKILAVQQDKRINQLLEESIRDVLVKYKKKSSLVAKDSFRNEEKCESEKPPNLPSPQGEEITIREIVTELKETSRAIEKGPRKVSSMIPGLTALIVGLFLPGVFFTANYSDLLRYKLDLDTRAIMLSRSEDCPVKAAKVGVFENLITGQQDESRESRPVKINGQTGIPGLPSRGMMKATVASEFEPASPTKLATSARTLPAPEIPASGEFFSCKLSAIAWDENPDRRLAVIDDRVLHEGDLVGGTTVLRINPDHVVFSDRDEVFIKKINTED